jgi:ABC-type Fe3+-siderophore transport system permease subunit
MKSLPILFLFTGALLWILAANALLPVHAWVDALFPAGERSIEQIRLVYGLMPRAVVAVLVGAALGLAGSLLQRVLRNPLADPTVLGVSAGAQLALVGATLFAPALLTPGRLPVALAGATASAALVFLIGQRRGFEPALMVVVGLLIGLMATSLAAALTLAHGQYLLSLVIWNGGSLVQQDWSAVTRLLAVLGICLLLAVGLLRPMQLLSIGAETAAALGMRVGLVRAVVITIAVLLTAMVSAEVGLIGFIGLAAPTIVRALGFRRDASRLIASMLVGAGLLLLCDSGVLLLDKAFGEMFPVGAVTGLIGGPLLLWLLPRLSGRTPPAGMAAGEPRLAASPLRHVTMLTALLVAGSLLGLALGRGPAGWTLLSVDQVSAFLPLRLPRLAAAIAAGALLAGAGAILQRTTSNPLASPEVMGVSSGAALGFGLAVFLMPAPDAMTLLLSCGLGGGVVLAIVARAALKTGMPTDRILLTGLALSALASAVLSAMMSGGDARAWVILTWLSGSTSTVGPMEAFVLLVLAGLLLLFCLLSTRWLAILPLGAEIAHGLGVSPLARASLFLAAGIATGTATVLVGPVSFVGLMAPHIARALGLTTARGFAAGSMLIGAFLMMLADAGSRLAAFPYELPLGLFATLLGTPWLLLHMTRQTR